MQTDIVLTVSESKRLIAKGVRELPQVKAALEGGVVAVAKGTTNAYLVEEFTGETIDRRLYCTGTTNPKKPSKPAGTANKLPDLVLVKGKKTEGETAVEYLAKMKAGDVFIKGANALNYERNQAGILIGHPTGGTIGAAIGTCVARRIHLVIPVGLEKSVPVDINAASAEIAAAGPDGRGATLWPVNGIIVTEIEALRLLAGVRALPCGAGGINGAEGSIRLALIGERGQIEAAEALLDGICGEPPFIA
ncbi:MAG TPA: hypothetical protein PL033_05805 [Candidatus Brocadiia bacterium]|nr:hypothetical protein [Candidatus Brocadiia bacterium]